MGKDWHSKGEKDAAKDSGRTGIANNISNQVFGNPNRNAPSDSKSKAEYNSGWNNTKSQKK